MNINLRKIIKLIYNKDKYMFHIRKNVIFIFECWVLKQFSFNIRTSSYTHFLFRSCYAYENGLLIKNRYEDI